MKCFMVIYDGAADVPDPSLQLRTPLETARCTHAEALAVRGCTGLIRGLRTRGAGDPERMLAACLGIRPFDPKQWSRGPLEAAGMELPIQERDVVYRGDLITLDQDHMREAHTSLSVDETKSLVQVLNDSNDRFDADFHLAGAGTLSVIFHNGPESVPPHPAPLMLVKERPAQKLDTRCALPLKPFWDWTREVLYDHPVNEVRLDLGENPANGLWLWGGGRRVTDVKAFGDHDVKGALMTRSLMARGIARSCGLDILDMENPYALADERAAFRLPEVVNSLQKHDFLMVYVEAPYTLGRHGPPAQKVRSLEALDFFVLGPLIPVWEACRPARILVTANGAVDSVRDQPVGMDIPFVLTGDGVPVDETRRWDETTGALGLGGHLDPDEIFEKIWKS